MDVLLPALGNVMAPMALLTLLLGTLAGMTIGALPGLSSTMGVALCIPITFSMPPELALILLGAVYVSSVYGGSVTAILLRTPGTDASIATALDGYPLAEAGRGGEALGMATLGSLFGGLFSVIVLIAIAPPLSTVALAFGPQEYTVLAIFGLVTIVGVASDRPLKGVLSAAVGLVLATVGLDAFTGVQRFTFGQSELFEGVPLLPVLIGLFSVSQAFNLCVPAGGGVLTSKEQKLKGRGLPLWHDIRRSLRTMLRSSVIGSVVGILPGAGTSIASFISYNEARRHSSTPERFGKGELEGVAASESANNAVTGGTLIPTLTLGIPGNAVTAVFVGGLTIHGLIPGPSLFTHHAETTYTLILSLLFANVLFAVLGLWLCRYLVVVTKVPGAVLGPMILVFSVIGTYALRNAVFDVWLAVAFGVVGYFMERWRYPAAPLVIALILGPILEVNFRRSMQIAHWDLTTFFTRPLSLTLCLLVVLAVAYPLWIQWRRRKLQR
ncbi:putative tricarboxylic transport membrane protein [Halomonas fontilapidosi]|uniref:Putative tricarboxylic transport membrane protein n=1 Tax=Halomonas fontilapidosi TaxID=616675 RepID=A0A7W5DKL7_9GAMM|nr:tripartite tricarboxylate transporter permease [Halomonas fontilapidosi]MBB3184616.1 putative tricarboxylic transport membrane protein [Halomonas fontilapidosi]